MRSTILELLTETNKNIIETESQFESVLVFGHYCWNEPHLIKSKVFSAQFRNDTVQSSEIEVDLFIIVKSINEHGAKQQFSRGSKQQRCDVFLFLRNHLSLITI